jgi:hypothetical protein
LRLTAEVGATCQRNTSRVAEMTAKASEIAMMASVRL